MPNPDDFYCEKEAKFIGVDLEFPPSISSAKGSSDILLKFPPMGFEDDAKLTG